MQIKSLAIRCQKCGCLSLSDTMACPKCGNNHRSKNVYKYLHEMINGISETSVQPASNTAPVTSTLTFL
jgi:uncharacterized membrane protein YvbJ